ncbi:hypothetical protein PINS_up020696 [Pythium insidiosum]|nr:hypothetical protein PINS_up020696 [Pythium insidiosum]
MSNVRVVGLLGNVVPHSTNVNFQLDDGTGVIDGRLFLHGDDLERAEEGDRQASRWHITHHFLETIYVPCYHTKGPLQSSLTLWTTAAVVESDEQRPPSATAEGAAHGRHGLQHGVVVLARAKAILDVLGTCTSDRGVKIDEIFGQLRGRITEDQLRDALNYLTSEGHVYSTIDENHFKRTA